MRQSLIPVLLLAIVALSSSNVLPMQPTQESTLGIGSQQHDNMFSDKLKNIFYTLPFDASQNNRQSDKISKYMDTNNNRADENFNGIYNKEENFDGEGFRKEQWHNYPRQLDRLHKYLFEDYNSDNQLHDVYDPDDRNDEGDNHDPSIDDVTNEFHIDSRGVHNIYDTVLATNNPLLILKIHLAYLNNGMPSASYSNQHAIENKLKNFIELPNVDDSLFSNEMNPAAKVKREGNTLQDSEISDENEDSTGDKKMVTKRLFSLWSRLQSLSHKGHELPHRRHLHAFYGLPDADGNGALTAEPRAFMRPPGSPLRWG